MFEGIVTQLTVTIVILTGLSVQSPHISIEDARIRGDTSILSGTVEVKCGPLWYTSCLYKYLASSEKEYVCNNCINTPCLKASAPEIRVDNSTQVTYPENTIRIIVCKVKGGIPAPIVRIVPREGAHILTEPASFTSKETKSSHSFYQERLEFYTQVEVNLSRDDNGAIYRCDVEQANFDSQTESIKLNVQYAPIILLPDNITVNEGNSITIECMVDSNPTATVGWYDPDGVQKSLSAILNIRKVSIVDMKNYSCIAENSIEDSTFSSSMTTVLYVNYVKLPIQVIVNEFEDVEINCTVVSYTDVTQVTWSDETKTIISNSSVLYLQNISRDDAGKYRCESKNRIENETQTTGQTTMLHVTYPPVVGGVPGIFTANDQDDVTLKCTADSYPESSITWYNSGGVAVSKTSTLDLKTVDHTYAGDYTCMAQNVIQGVTYTDSSTASLFVTFAPIVNVSQTVTGVQFDDIVIECVVLSYPMSTVTWQNQNSEDISNSSSLILNYVRLADAGKYTCTAENVIQGTRHTERASTTLYLTRHPKCYVPVPTRVKQHCRCNKRCTYLKKIRNITTAELKEAIEQTKKELTVEPTTLTSYTIRKISMKDSRTSSIGMGVIGITIMLVVLGFLSAGDIIGVVQYCSDRKKPYIKSTAVKTGVKDRIKRKPRSMKKRVKKQKKVDETLKLEKIGKGKDILQALQQI